MSAGPDPAPIEDATAVEAAATVVSGAANAAGAAMSVTQLVGLLGDAVRSAGLVELWVSGTVTGLRPGARFTTLELVDYEADGSTVQSVLSVGMFAASAREIKRTLAVAGTELADGLQVALWGLIDLNPRYGRSPPPCPAGRSSHHGGRCRAGPRRPRGRTRAQRAPAGPGVAHACPPSPGGSAWSAPPGPPGEPTYSRSSAARPSRSRSSRPRRR